MTIHVLYIRFCFLVISCSWTLEVLVRLCLVVGESTSFLRITLERLEKKLQISNVGWMSFQKVMATAHDP